MTGNIAANFLDNPFFQQFIRKLRPSYKLPARNGKYSKALVPAEFKRVQEAVKEATDSADFLSITSDGWSDVSGNRLINVLVHTPKPYLFSTIDATLTAHTGEYICNILSIQIEALGKVFQNRRRYKFNFRSSKGCWSCYRQCGEHEESVETDQQEVSLDYR